MFNFGQNTSWDSIYKEVDSNAATTKFIRIIDKMITAATNPKNIRRKRNKIPQVLYSKPSIKNNLFKKAYEERIIMFWMLIISSLKIDLPIKFLMLNKNCIGNGSTQIDTTPNNFGPSFTN